MRSSQSTLAIGETEGDWSEPRPASLEDDLRTFHSFGTRSQVIDTIVAIPSGDTARVPTFINEFWTAKQRAANSLHEISYRACFKPQLPQFFIERLSGLGETIHDPFMGRGTTLLEAALRGRIPFGTDANPLSTVLIRPRLRPPTLGQVSERLREIDLTGTLDTPRDLLAFYHPATLLEICRLREYLRGRATAGALDSVDEWIRMVAVNRLTGHSTGFLSVYTLPPNQAVSVKAQMKINEARGQVPPRRDVKGVLLAKSRSLLEDCTPGVRRGLDSAALNSLILARPAALTPEIESGTVTLAVTSPPFLDTVDYASDNWLRCWFCGIDPQALTLTVPRQLSEWTREMTAAFKELRRVLKPGGHVAFEVGEIRRGKLKLEETVIGCGIAAGLEPRLILINSQSFTKTSNSWGVSNGRKGTNTNRVVLFRSAGPNRGVG
jgi:hypothetical protein